MLVFLYLLCSSQLSGGGDYLNNEMLSLVFHAATKYKSFIQALHKKAQPNNKLRLYKVIYNVYRHKARTKRQRSHFIVIIYIFLYLHEIAYFSLYESYHCCYTVSVCPWSSYFKCSAIS